MQVCINMYMYSNPVYSSILRNRVFTESTDNIRIYAVFLISLI